MLFYIHGVIIAWYIIREHIAPFFYAIFIITFLFMVDFLIRILDSILSKGLAWNVVLEIIILNLAWMLALSIPMAVLVSTLMAFGRLSGDNEITALKSCGISPLKLIFPLLVLALLLAGGLVWFNNDVLPDANHRAAALRADIGRKKPTAMIQERSLIKDFENYRIWINEIDYQTGNLSGIKIYHLERGKPIRYTYADSATMEYANGGKTILIRLRNGQNHILDHSDKNQYVRVDFSGQVIAIENVDAQLERSERSYRSDREMSIEDMYEEVNQAKQRKQTAYEEYREKIFDDMRTINMLMQSDTVSGSVPPRLLNQPWMERAPLTKVQIAQVIRHEQDKQYLIQRWESRSNNEKSEINEYLVEIHKKFSIPVACLIFVLIGAPLGIMARKGGVGTGVIYSIIFFLVYWVCLIRGEVLADRLILEPWVAMWAPNLIVGLAGIWLVWRMLRENYLGSLSRFKMIKNKLKVGKSAARPV